MWGIDWMPNDREEKDCLGRSSQIFAMGFLCLLGFILAIGFSWVLIPFMIYYIIFCLIRGLRNRWDLFTKGNRVCSSYFIDGWLCFFFFTTIGAVVGNFWGKETCAGSGMCAAMISGLLEMIYYAAEHMQVPPVDTVIASQMQGTNHYMQSFFKVKKVNNWYWVGYQHNEGPKEDNIFPITSQI